MSALKRYARQMAAVVIKALESRTRTRRWDRLFRDL